MPPATQAQGLTPLPQTAPHGLSLNWDLKSFHVDAKVDWITLVLRLAWCSQQQHIRNLLVPQLGAGIYVTALTEEGLKTEKPNDTTSVFLVRVQDPESAASILAAINGAIQDKQSALSANAVSVHAIEVAIDVYPIEGRAPANSLAALVADLCRYRDSIPIDHGHLRVAANDRAAVNSGAVLYFRDIQRAATEPASFHSGNAALGHEQRVYLKTKDTKPGKEYALLPANMHRARFETTFRGKHLPFTTLEGWQTFKFESLRKGYFRWRIVEQEPPIAEASPIPLIRRLSRSEPGINRRKGVSGTKVDQDFGQVVKNALERLTRAQARPWSPRLNKK